jgi:hypothetical protein
MKIDRGLKSQLDRIHNIEVQLKKEIENKRILLKKATNHQIELAVYERQLQNLRMMKTSRLGYNIDKEI